jgi:cell division septation protein DedD
MDAMGMMRDLDQIREREDGRESTKLVLIALGGLAAACVLFAVGVMIGREGEPTRQVRREDPLARLDALAGQVAAQTAPTVTYPSRLVDAPPAEAQPAAAAHAEAAPTLPSSAPVEATGRGRALAPAATALPVAPSIQGRLAPASSPSAAPAPAGSDGAFTLQVSSFRNAASAQTFAQRLRERGHRAFVTTGPVSHGAAWHRVRIGPFSSLREAQRYRGEFEATERMPTFVVRRDDRPAR